MAGTQEILHGSLLKQGTLPKSAGDTAFQAFLDDLLSKDNGGTVAGEVYFDSGSSQVFSVSGGQVGLVGSGALFHLSNGAELGVSSTASFVSHAPMVCTAAPTDPEHLATKGYIDDALGAATVRFAAPRAPTTGAVDGVNKVFVFAAVELAADGEFVEVDGLRVYKTLDYTIAFAAGDTTVTFVDAPPSGVRVRLGGFKA